MSCSLVEANDRESAGDDAVIGWRAAREVPGSRGISVGCALMAGD